MNTQHLSQSIRAYRPHIARYAEIFSSFTKYVQPMIKQTQGKTSKAKKFVPETA